MKKLLLPLTITGVLLLVACGNSESDKKEESKKDKTESVEKNKETSKQDDSEKNTSTQDNNTDKQTEQVATEEPQSQEEERDSEGLTQKDRDRIATEQAKEYAKNHPEEEQSNEGEMGPGPGDPNYKPDPKFTDPGEGYDPVEGNKMPSADSYEFKQEVENPARDQVINEGIGYG